MTSDHYLVIAVSVLVLTVAVVFHYESLVLLGRAVSGMTRHRRRSAMVLVLGLLVVHGLEIVFFGACAWGLIEYGVGGELLGPSREPLARVVDFLDYVYLSAMTYTTVGYGDLAPYGPVRFLFASIALAGFVLITWSASFTFIEMQRHWRPN